MSCIVCLLQKKGGNTIFSNLGFQQQLGYIQIEFTIKLNVNSTVKESVEAIVRKVISGKLHRNVLRLKIKCNDLVFFFCTFVQSAAAISIPISTLGVVSASIPHSNSDYKEVQFKSCKKKRENRNEGEKKMIEHVLAMKLVFWCE